MWKVKNGVTGGFFMQINVSAKKWQHIQQMAAIGEMTTGIVHDLKNQLACIGANMGLLEIINKQESESIEKYVANIKRQVGYANEMVELMLRMGSREAGHTTFDLALLMDDVATFFERVAGRGITIKTYVDDSDHLISGCQVSISNSILNLCANARDAIGESGMIEVSLTRKQVDRVDNDIMNQNMNGECSILMVRDNGSGIESDKLDEIFEPFFTTKGMESMNMGMGLPNVMHTAREHGISMTVDSKPNAGTTFKLYFKAITD